MEKQRILSVIMFLLVCLPGVTLADDNPFDKEVNINIGSDREWLFKDKTFTRSGEAGGDFYHLFFDRTHLRLRITENAEDSEATARQYQQFAVEDIRIDGQQLPLFQWCLGNQQKHSRFLQQGLKVKQGVCDNRGDKGTFIMKLNADTWKALSEARSLSFKLKPFRSSINVNFDISDFADAVAKLTAKAVPAQKAQAVAPVMEKPVVVKKCKASPPQEFNKISPVEYNCDDAAAKVKAEAGIEAQVKKEREQEAKLAAERERKLKEAEAAKKAEAERLAAEQAALAQVEASKKEINAEITNKMLAVCMKQWEKGEQRCYCEEFLEHAPAGIKSDPSCAQ